MDGNHQIVRETPQLTPQEEILRIIDETGSVVDAILIWGNHAYSWAITNSDGDVCTTDQNGCPSWLEDDEINEFLAWRAR